MYKCSLCERSFLRKQDLTQHYRQLHSYSKPSRTLSWVQDQQLNSNANLRQEVLDDNIWGEFNSLDIFIQATNSDNNQNDEVFA